MKVQYFEAGLVIVILLVVTALDWVMPTLTRRDLLFGVTVAPNSRETDAGRRIITRYRIGIIIVDILVAAGVGLLLAFAPDDFWRAGLSALIILVAVLLFGVPYLMAHFASRSLAVVPQAGERSQQPQVAPAAELRPRHYGDYVPLIWELLPLAIIAATVAYLATQYASAPAIIATHFDTAGNANAYRPKTIGSYFALVWSQLGLYLLLTIVSILMVGAKVIPGRAEERFRRIWLRMIFAIKTFLLALFGFLAVAIAQAATGKHFAAAWIAPVTIGATLVMLVAVFAVSLRTGQGGARLDPATATTTDRMDDRYWKYGAFYVNASDPSLFVERRYGVGWTLNFGNPRAIAVFAGVLALPIVIAVLSIVFSTTR